MKSSRSPSSRLARIGELSTVRVGLHSVRLRTHTSSRPRRRGGDAASGAHVFFHSSNEHARLPMGARETYDGPSSIVAAATSLHVCDRQCPTVNETTIRTGDACRADHERHDQRQTRFRNPTHSSLRQRKRPPQIECLESEAVDAADTFGGSEPSQSAQHRVD